MTRPEFAWSARARNARTRNARSAKNVETQRVKNAGLQWKKDEAESDVDAEDTSRSGSSLVQ